MDVSEYVHQLRSVLIIMVLYLHKIDALTCYCTTVECLEQGTNMCTQSNPQLGCYKQYFAKESPALKMGCVSVHLICETIQMRPDSVSLLDWPFMQCCYSDHCNRDILLPALYSNHSRKLEALAESTPPTTAEHPEANVHVEIITDSSTHYTQTVTDNSNSESRSSVHPVFLLLLILVFIFVAVVIASLFVIVRIWLYRRRRDEKDYIRKKVLHERQRSALLNPVPNWSERLEGPDTSTSTLTISQVDQVDDVFNDP